MPNCSVMLFRQGTVVANEIIAAFSDDFVKAINTAVTQAKLETEPDMAIVWLGIRAFGFWYRGPLLVKPMYFKLLSKVSLLSTNLVWPKGVIVPGIPAFNLTNWYVDQKFYIDHPYRTRVCEYSERFGIDTEPESMMIDADDFSLGLVEAVPVY